MNQGPGNKRQCPKCSAKFFDLNALEPTCPKCRYVFPPAKLAVKKPIKVAVQKPKPVKKPVIEDETIGGLAVVAELEELDAFDDDLQHFKEVEDHHEEPEVDVNSDDAEDDMFIDDIAVDDVHIIDEPEEAQEDSEQEI